MPKPFRYPLKATIAAVSLIGVLLVMGMQQVQRHLVEETLAAAYKARMGAPAIPLAADMGTPHDYLYAKIFAKGRFLNEKSLLVQAEGEGLNRILLTPFALDDGSYVWVRRQRVPVNFDLGSPLPDTDRIEGLVRLAKVRTAFMPDNDPSNDQWHRIAPMAMGAARSLTPVRPYYIELADEDGTYAPPETGRGHFVQAIVWFLMAFVGVVIYVEYVRRVKKRAAP